MGFGWHKNELVCTRQTKHCWKFQPETSTVSRQSETDREEIQLERFPCRSLEPEAKQKRFNCQLGEERRWDSCLGPSFIRRWDYDVVVLFVGLNNCWCAFGEGRGLKHHKYQIEPHTQGKYLDFLALQLSEADKFLKTSSSSSCLPSPSSKWHNKAKYRLELGFYGD